MEMMLTKKSLSKWLEKLKSYTIYAPELKESLWSYEIIEDVSKVTLNYPQAIHSPKKIVFPQREILMEFAESDSGLPVLTETLPKDDPTIVFGVRPCEGKSLLQIDKVFAGDFNDPYYWKRRNQTIIVGLACNQPPDPNCFCTSVDGSPFATDGLDIAMVDVGNDYYVEILTDKGKDIWGKAKDLFNKADPGMKALLKKMQTESEGKISRQIDNIDRVPPNLMKMFDAPQWESDSIACITCGICTFLCPTCHCFDINDEIETTTPLKGKRVRTWDTCQFPDFTMHSSGHNPRPDKASRLRQRVMHKFNYFVQKYNSYMCTGCGRCITKCPVGIDIATEASKAGQYE